MIDISVGVLSFLTTTSLPWSSVHRRFSSNHCFLSSILHESPTFRSIFRFSSARFSFPFFPYLLAYTPSLFFLPLRVSLSRYPPLLLRYLHAASRCGCLSRAVQLWAPPYVSIAIGKWNPWWSRCHGDSLHSLTSAHLTSPRRRAFISHPACSSDLIKTGLKTRRHRLRSLIYEHSMPSASYSPLFSPFFSFLASCLRPATPSAPCPLHSLSPPRGPLLFSLLFLAGPPILSPPLLPSFLLPDSWTPF